MLYGLCGVCNVHAWRGDVSSVICGFVCGMGSAVCVVCTCGMWCTDVWHLWIVCMWCITVRGLLIVWCICDVDNWSVVCVVGI